VEKDSERDRLFDLWRLRELAHTTSLTPRRIDPTCELLTIVAIVEWERSAIG
jgi:hypothetical protein